MHINPNNHNSEGISFSTHKKILAQALPNICFILENEGRKRKMKSPKYFVLKITQVKNYFQLEFKIWVRSSKNYLEM